MLCLKSIQFTITDRDFDAIAELEELQEIVLDCDQPPEGQGQTDEAKWGLLHFPEAMKQLTNMTHLTLSCHYGITALPQGISRLDKLEVNPPCCMGPDWCALWSLSYILIEVVSVVVGIEVFMSQQLQLIGACQGAVQQACVMNPLHGRFCEAVLYTRGVS